MNDAIRFKYMTLITHGAMLSPERGLALWRAGRLDIEVSEREIDAEARHPGHSGAEPTALYPDVTTVSHHDSAFAVFTRSGLRSCSLGAVAKNQRPAWFKIAPAVPGAFRWSGTSILIFTPDIKKKLPFSSMMAMSAWSGWLLIVTLCPGASR